MTFETGKNNDAGKVCFLRKMKFEDVDLVDAEGSVEQLDEDGGRISHAEWVLEEKGALV